MLKKAIKKEESPLKSPEATLPDGVSIGDTVTAENLENMIGLDYELLMTPTITKYREDGSTGRELNDAEGYKNIIQYWMSMHVSWGLKDTGPLC